jgi:arylsulfatase A
VEEIDWSVGEILKTLKDSNLDKNTFVFFTSDNGPWLTEKEDGGSAGLLRSGKGTTWEGGMREPAIAWWPGRIKASTVNDQLCCSMDLYTTILTLADIPVPDDRIIDGVDMSPLLFQEGKSVRDLFFYYEGTKIYAVRKNQWKAHFYTIENEFTDNRQDIKQDPPLLFNLEVDPSEQYNLSDQYPEIIEDIKRELKIHQDKLMAKPSQLEKLIKK